MAEEDKPKLGDDFIPEGGVSIPDTLNDAYLLHVLGNPMQIIAGYETWAKLGQLHSLERGKIRCLRVIQHLEDKFSQDFHLFPGLRELLAELRVFVEQEQWEKAVQAYMAFTRNP